MKFRFEAGMNMAAEKEAPKEEEKKEGEAEEKKPAAAPAPAKKPLPAWAVGAMAGSFFVVAAGIGYVAWLIVQTYHLVDDSIYLKTFANGRVIEKKAYEDDLGWGSELLIDKKPGKPARIRFMLRDKDRKPITDATVQVTVIPLEDYQPNDPGAAKDKNPPKAPVPRSSIAVPLKMVEPGVYRGEADIKGSGEWEARIQVKEGQNAYQVSERISVPDHN